MMILKGKDAKPLMGLQQKREKKRWLGNNKVLDEHH
jgi:hypothetical protein